MKKVMVVGCGAYMEDGYGCPGEWRCLKAAAMGDGKFDESVQVIAFLKCHCPGRSLAPNVGMAIKLSDVKPDVIHLSSCMAHAKPEQFAQIIQDKTGVPVNLGTHNYH